MKESQDRPRIERVDWFLQVFVELANEEPFEMPVTLASGGMIISGDLVSGRRYFEGFADEFSAAISNTTDDVRTFWHDFLSGFGSSVYGDREARTSVMQSEESSTTEEDPSDPHYIHLRDARIYHAGNSQSPLVTGVWWRARMEAVDGFFLGAIGVPPRG